MTSPRWGAIDRLLGLAESIAGAWSGRARTSTTVAQERALLRLFGVNGLDSAGNPLAAAAVHRYVGSRTDRLASGIALPFAVALLEYDIGPQQLAYDVARGEVDLAMEAELLHLPDRRAAAEAELGRLAAAATQRIDANRIARRELLDVIGDGEPPWLGATLESGQLDAARPEMERLIADGADFVRIGVPVGRELAERLSGIGVESAGGAGNRRDAAFDDDEGDRVDRPPAGSQRGLATLRELADEAAAERRRYVRLGMVIPALSAPEAALVAAFERIDVLEADPIAEIVEAGVAPDRALADNAFARRLARRAGTTVVLGPGPLIVAPEIARGVPSDPATRAGRAFALAVLDVALARADGIRPDQIVLGAVPPWVAEERQPAIQALAGVLLRRIACPDVGLLIGEPDFAGAPEAAARWPFLMAAALTASWTGSAPRAASVVVRRTRGSNGSRILEETRAAAAVAAELGQAGDPLRLRGSTAEHARAALEVAVTTLRVLSDQGWRELLGSPQTGRDGDRGTSRGQLGADAVVDRSESLDVLGPG